MKPIRILFLLALCVCAQVTSYAAQYSEEEWANLLKQLRAGFQQFPLLTPATNSDGQPVFQKLPNETPVVIDGTNYYGFRFKVPSRKNAEDFVWATLQPQFLIGWQIIPEKGEMLGFAGYRYTAKTTYRSTSKLLPAPLRRLIVQSLDGDCLKDGETYLIWWSLSGRARQMYLSFTFAPLGPDGLNEFGPMEKALALVRVNGSPPPVPANPSISLRQGKDFDSLLEKLMKDPEMMKVMQEQQGQVLKTQYAPLIKQLNLAPDQRDAFYKVLMDNTTNDMAQALAMMSGTNHPDTASAVAGSQKNMHDQVRSLLGDTGYAQFQDFEMSLPDRMMFEQMKTSFTDNPLTEDQQQRLLQIMIVERKNSAPAAAPGGGKPAVSAANLAGQTEQALQTQEQVNRRVYQQAADFLSPGQLQSLGNSQSNLLRMTKMSMSMMQEFMGTNADDEPDGQ